MVSCSEDFEARAPFQPLASPYGFLRVDADTQWVRIATTRPEIDRPASVSGQGFRFRHFVERDTVEWRPTVKVLDDGRPALLFYTTAGIKPETDYTVELTGDGYPAVTADLRSPKSVETIDVDDPNPYIRPFRQTFFIHEVDDFFRIDLTVWVRMKGENEEEPKPYPVTILDAGALQWSERGITAVINHDETIRQLFNFGHLQVRPSPESEALIDYQLDEISLNVTLTHDGWFPRHFNWNDSYAQILEYTNTNTGSGFVGAASISRRSWRPPAYLKLYFNYDGWEIEVE